MRSLGTKYVTYFNHKYDRVGHLFQGTYRARLIKNPEDLINTSAYIHNNPRKGESRINPKNYEYSSLSSYAHKSEDELISKTYISEIMKIEDYVRFVDAKLKERIDLG
jgi:putative transposase